MPCLTKQAEAGPSAHLRPGSQVCTSVGPLAGARAGALSWLPHSCPELCAATREASSSGSPYPSWLPREQPGFHLWVCWAPM